MSEDSIALPDPLDPVEARLLGCLIEKEATTPDAYPLTVNATVLAANQKTNREPVMALEPGEVGHALRRMERKGLVRAVDGGRATRYEHCAARAWSLTTRQQALLALLLLRGPQTAGELLLRSERLASFTDLDEVRHTLDRLMQRSPALVVNLGRAPGQREDRYMHLLCGPVSAELLGRRDEEAAGSDGALAERVAMLETALEALRAEVATLRARLGAD
ncbi:YceH family protein [Rehaibacterium terrae]|jgi:uncharacterized protein YceH (UPF0502 family)|uniref:Uncharacterized protein n=1 Tax=Rehaibacterium terrae TaxID=1341696 RepID=A0A7W8DF24_9GAMM|nr:YceH family protein [Rehaibacterium terrae]MBB5016020.1 hypothetical protein [Rehaibacterium terrae]